MLRTLYLMSRYLSLIVECYLLFNIHGGWSPWWHKGSIWNHTFRLSQSSCWPEGDQKRSDRGEKFFRYFSCRTSVVQQPQTFREKLQFRIRFATTKPRFSLQVSTCWTTSVETLPQHEISLSKCWSTKGRPESCQAGSSPSCQPPPQDTGGLLVISDPTKLLLCWKNACFFCNECIGLYFFHFTVKPVRNSSLNDKIFFLTIFFLTKLTYWNECTWSSHGTCLWICPHHGRPAISVLWLNLDPALKCWKPILALLPQNLWLLICRYIEKVLKIGAVAGHNTRDIEFSKVTNWTEMAVLCTITVTDFTIFSSSDKLKWS